VTERNRPTNYAQLLRAAQAVAPAEVEALDAELLLAFALGRNRSGLYARLRDEIDACIADRFDALWQRRCAGEPYAYLVGEREFYGRAFAVDRAVLIPRAGTETLLEAALARWPVERCGFVVDAGTGSGALAISFQLERPASTVCAVDFSAAALRVARANATALGAPLRVWRGDWLSALADRSVDLLMSNPPYLGDDDPHLPGLVASGEPRSALVADDGGLADLQRLAADARRVLQPGAWLLLEHGWTQGDDVRRLLAGLGYAEVCTIADLSGNQRVSAGRSKSQGR
jgi:release factor glutamine methyltransferase